MKLSRMVLTQAQSNTFFWGFCYNSYPLSFRANYTGYSIMQEQPVFKNPIDEHYLNNDLPKTMQGWKCKKKEIKGILSFEKKRLEQKIIQDKSNRKPFCQTLEDEDKFRSSKVKHFQQRIQEFENLLAKIDTQMLEFMEKEADNTINETIARGFT